VLRDHLELAADARRVLEEPEVARAVEEGDNEIVWQFESGHAAILRWISDALVRLNCRAPARRSGSRRAQFAIFRLELEPP